MGYLVTRIIDTNRIEISPEWTWASKVGNIVKILGYDTPDEKNSALTKAKLEILLLNKTIEIKKISGTHDEDNLTILDCGVYLNGIDISEYFPELRHSVA